MVMKTKDADVKEEKAVEKKPYMKPALKPYVRPELRKHVSYKVVTRTGGTLVAPTPTPS